MFKKLEITLLENGHYSVALTKAFEPEYGGGEQTFVENGGRNIHGALDVARGMVTVSRSYRQEAQS